jgi:hypothetical protein
MANNISTLKSDIAEMEEVFNDASTPSDIKKALEPALKKAKEDLVELEKKETVEKPAVTKKEVTTKKSPSDALKKCQDLLAKYQNKKENDAERVKKRASQGKPPTLTPAETVKSTAKKVEAKVVDMMERTGEGLQSTEINQLASGIIATIKSTLEGIEDTTKKHRFLKEIGKEIHDLEKRLPKAAAMGMYMADGGSIDDKYMIYGTSDEGWFAVDKKTRQQISPSIFGKGGWDSKEEVIADLNSKKFADGGSIADSNKEMLMSNVHSIKHHAEEIENILANNVPVEAWVSAKAERASTDLSDITHYLDGLIGKMAIGGMLEHDLRRGDEVKEIYKDYGILEDADMNIFVYDPNVGERIDVSSVNEAKRMIDSMDMDLRKRAGLMADGGKLTNYDRGVVREDMQKFMVIAKTSKDGRDFVEKARTIKNVSPTTSDWFFNRYESFDMFKASDKFVKEVKDGTFDINEIYADGGEMMANGGQTFRENEKVAVRIKPNEFAEGRIVRFDNQSGSYVVSLKDKYESQFFDSKDIKKMADGGHTQGYDDREDERLSMEYGKISGKDFVGSDKTREHSRRDDARFEDRMAKGGYMEVKNPDAQMKAATIQEAVKIATVAVNNGIKASDLTFEEFSNKIFDLTSTSFGKAYLKLAYESLKSSGYADGGTMAKGGKLIGKQKNIDVNKNGKLDAQDFKLLRQRAKARLKK